MTPEQALKILDEVTKNVSANRDTHQAILIALETIKKLIESQVEAAE